VQVVLGEGEPGILRIILEAEGFHVVGQARGESELRRVLDATHPSVVVLDAGISAPAALDARTRAIGAQLVVVWPIAVKSGLADECVDPASVLLDLGKAVRRAAERAHPILDETAVAPPVSPVIDPGDASDRPLRAVPPLREAAPPRPRRRVGILVAASLLLLLTATAALGFVPRAMQALHLIERRGTPHAPTAPAIRPEPTPAVAAPTDDGAAQPRSCGRAGDRTQGPRREHGAPEHAAACSRGNGGTRGHGNGNGNRENGGVNAHSSDNGGGSGKGAGKGPAEEPGARGNANGRPQGGDGHP
jgi:hypothetical protein